MMTPENVLFVVNAAGIAALATFSAAVMTNGHPEFVVLLVATLPMAWLLKRLRFH